MEWVETTAESIDMARAKALDLLNVEAADAEIEVVEDVKKGLFGRVKSEARVRARIRPKAPAPKDDRRNRRSGGGGGGRGRGGNSGGNRNKSGKGSGDRNRNSGSNKGGNSGGRNNSGKSNSGSNKSGNSSGRDSGSRDSGRSSQGAKAGAAAAAGAGAAAAVASKSSDRGSQDSGSQDSGSRNDGGRDSGNRDGGRNDGGRKSGGRDSGRSTNNDRSRSNKSDNNKRNQEPAVTEEFSVSDQQAVMHEFVSGAVAVFDSTATVEVVDLGEDTLEAQVSGEDLGLLVGPSGATLAALEELTRTAMQRAAQGRRYHRIHVDVDGYKERRREALGRFARQVADDAMDSGERKALESMNAADRKVVHDALSDVEGVSTLSEGDDPRRYVVVVPD